MRTSCSASGTHTRLGSDPIHGISAVQQPLCMQRSSPGEPRAPAHREGVERENHSTPPSNSGPGKLNSG